MIVMKFGGTSVGDDVALRHVCEIVRDGHEAAAGRGVVVVTSAMKGVTNILLEAAQAAANGRLELSEAAYRQLQSQHVAVLDSLVPDHESREQLRQDMTHVLRHLQRLLESVSVIGELTPKGEDWIAGTGEIHNGTHTAAGTPLC